MRILASAHRGDNSQIKQQICKGLTKMEKFNKVKISAGRSVFITEESTEGNRSISRIVHSQDFMIGAPAEHNEAHIMRAVLFASAPDLLECLELAYQMLEERGALEAEPITMQELQKTITSAKTLPMPLDEALAGLNVPRSTATREPQKVYRINEPVNYNATSYPTSTRASFNSEPKAPTKSADELAQDEAMEEMRKRLGL